MEATSQIIVVEDDPADFELITHALWRAGGSFVARRVDTQEALDAELFRLSPDLVVCDHGSAKWNSFSILQQVRAFEPTMPFVVVSGGLDTSTELALRASGVDHCLTKDRLSDLAAALRRVLREHGEVRRQRVDEIRRSAMPWDPPVPPAETCAS